ncbi:hypothetical protein A0J61_10879 [Choanephora cucurbitarum]|uniref:Uncharacterized protein n=1 Tax=Choanephora cucurbitarum TaxID=101091 RepID=A0A1C7MW93_9FUNG|nr:hypothetical protein A0J61_10879 [Choanephora cucurbitarum]
MAMDSWLARAILSSIFWNSKPKKAASKGSTQTASQAGDFNIPSTPPEINVSFMAEDDLGSENQLGQASNFIFEKENKLKKQSNCLEDIKV